MPERVTSDTLGKSLGNPAAMRAMWASADFGL